MAIPTSRTNEIASIVVDETRCKGCGLCVEVCKDFSLEIRDGKCRLSSTPVFGCIACGHCMAICQNDAIRVTGRFLSPEDLFPLPAREAAASYDGILNLLQRRRSIREFKDKPVEPEVIRQILDAARTAPMGLPPSDVRVLVLDSKEKLDAFSKDFCDYLVKLGWMTSGWFLTLMRPFWGKANDELFRGFIRPLFRIYTGSMQKGINYVTYDAPAGIYFYGSPYSDPADPIVAATYAMIAAESLGLGTCMIGGIHPFIQSGSAARKFREEHGIRYKSKEGLFVILGYPRVKYKYGLRRTFAS